MPWLANGGASCETLNWCTIPHWDSRLLHYLHYSKITILQHTMQVIIPFGKIKVTSQCPVKKSKK